MRWSDADREAIHRADEMFARNASAIPRNDQASVGYYEADAIMLAPGQRPIVGHAAIAAFLSAFPPFSDYRLEVAEIQGDGDLAFERGTASMIIAATEPPSHWRVNYLVIWRRQVDGSWKVAREIFTPAAQSPVAAPPSCD